MIFENFKFSGINDENQTLMTEILVDTVEGPGLLQVGFSNEDFTIFSVEESRINKQLELEMDEVKKTVLKEKLAIIILLNRTMSDGLEPGGSIIVKVNEILSLGVNLFIEKAKLQLIYSGEDLSDQVRVKILKELLSKINLETITGAQFVDLGIFLSNIKNEDDKYSFEEYESEMSTQIESTIQKQVEKDIEKQAKIIKNNFKAAKKNNDINYFISLGEKCIELGQKMEDLEVSIFGNSLLGVISSDVNIETRVLH